MLHMGTHIHVDTDEKVLPSGEYRFPQGFFSLALNQDRDATILTARMDYLLALADECLEGVTQLSADRDLTDAEREVLDRISLRTVTLLHEPEQTYADEGLDL